MLQATASIFTRLNQVLRKHGESAILAEEEAQLCRMSPSTIDRWLKPWRRLRGHRFFLEADRVTHCGKSAKDFYLNTLSTVDVATGWTAESTQSRG